MYMSYSLILEAVYSISDTVGHATDMSLHISSVLMACMGVIFGHLRQTV